MSQVVLDAKIPKGPIEDKWSNHKASVKLVNPANKRKYTIIVVGKGAKPVYAACVVLATHRLDVNRTIKGRFGRKASFASPDETRNLTGHEIGGVTVFGLPGDLPVWVDAAVMKRDRIVLGGGRSR